MYVPIVCWTFKEQDEEVLGSVGYSICMRVIVSGCQVMSVFRN